MTNAQSLCLHAQKLGETGAQLFRLSDRAGDVAISDTPKIALQRGLARGALPASPITPRRYTRVIDSVKLYVNLDDG